MNKLYIKIVDVLIIMVLSLGLQYIVCANPSESPPAAKDLDKATICTIAKAHIDAIGRSFEYGMYPDVESLRDSTLGGLKNFTDEQISKVIGDKELLIKIMTHKFSCP